VAIALPAEANRLQRRHSSTFLRDSAFLRFSDFMSTVTIYRLVGREELGLVAAGGYRAFPPRLPYTSIFHLVEDEGYADKIAEQWNEKAKRLDCPGAILECDLDSEFLRRFEFRRTIFSDALEYRVRAKDLDEFNQHIQGEIRVIKRFPPRIPVVRGIKEPRLSGMSTKTLYRPVGQKELDLIAAAGYRAFPPRLPDQPVFYPVLTREYAEKIARDWNTRDERSGYVGYVLEFEVDADYLSQFEIRKAGASVHREYWIPADRLDESNRHIRGEIRVIQRFPTS
jgi:hypothetical protein